MCRRQTTNKWLSESSQGVWIDWVCPHVCASAPSRPMPRVAHGTQNVPVIVPFGSPHFGAQVPPLLTHSIPPFLTHIFSILFLVFLV